MSMIYCRGCGKQIHESATACPECGAIQNVIVANAGTQKPTKQYPGLSDTWVWIMGCIPILTIMLSVFAIGPSVISVIFSFIIVPMIPNCVFTFFDVKELKRNQLNVGRWVWFGILLVPVYMLLRASKSNKQYGYAILWCCLFALALVSFSEYGFIYYSNVGGFTMRGHDVFWQVF